MRSIKPTISALVFLIATLMLTCPTTAFKTRGSKSAFEFYVNSLYKQQRESGLGKVCDEKLFKKIVDDMGYPTQAHRVVTEDGYVLRLFRIQSKDSDFLKPKPPVLLQHGLLDSADDWVLNLNNSLGTYLADQGYDVWLSNSRGNKYSKKNERIGPWRREFWHYSFQQMGQYDVPANIKYILDMTLRDKLIYVGHSQGTSQMFAALSDPLTSDYVNSKVSKFIALAPVVYLPNSPCTFIKVIGEADWIIDSAEIFGIEEWLPGACSTDSAQARFEKFMCKRLPIVCDFVTSLFDFNPKYDDLKRMPYFVEHNPSGTSLQTLLHYRQNLLQKDKLNPDFKMYDYGKKGNEKHYGQKTAPSYDLSKIKIPVRGFVGIEDKLGDMRDNDILKANLQNLKVNYKEYIYENCGHMTFMWGKDMSKMWADVLKEMKEE